MARIICYIAASLDGYIAAEGDDLSWLEQSASRHGYQGDYGFKKFLASVQGALWGAKTYAYIVKLVGSNPHPEKATYVFSRRKLKLAAGEQLVNTDAVAFVKKLKKAKQGDYWLVGGGQLLASLAKAGLVDELILNIAPVALGQGTPLFGTKALRLDWDVVGKKNYKSGFTELRLKPARR